MLTVGQAKEKGVVFVEGDVLGDGFTITEKQALNINNNAFGDRYNHYQVTSFTDRKRTGDEMPCGGDLPVVVHIHGLGHGEGYIYKFNWAIEGGSFYIKSWKPDLEELKKLSNKKEEKPMTPSRSKAETAISTLDQLGYTFKGGELWEPPVVAKQYTYELVTDLTTNEIAKAMIDGEVFYGENHKFEYKWLGNKFNINLIDDEFYRRKEIETITRTITYPKPVSEPLNDGAEHWVVFDTRIERCHWVGDRLDANRLFRGKIHLTKENAQAHWDALFEV